MTSDGMGLEVDPDIHARVGPTKTAIDICGFTLGALQRANDDTMRLEAMKALKERGLRFAHLLEALQQWETTPIHSSSTATAVPAVLPTN